MIEKPNGRHSKLEQIFSSEPMENPVFSINYHDDFGQYEIELSGASSDHFAVFEHPGKIIVLITNARYKAATLRVYESGKKVREFSFEGKAEVRRYLGNKGFRLSDLEIATRLYKHVQGIENKGDRM